FWSFSSSSFANALHGSINANVIASHVIRFIASLPHWVKWANRIGRLGAPSLVGAESHHPLGNGLGEMRSGPVRDAPRWVAERRSDPRAGRGVCSLLERFSATFPLTTSPEVVRKGHRLSGHRVAVILDASPRGVNGKIVQSWGSPGVPHERGGR